METINSFIQDNPLASIIVSAVLGGIISALISYIFYKRQMKRTPIRFNVTDPLSIGSGLSNLFPNIKVTYEGYPQNDDIKYIKGTFINESKRDIDTSNDNGEIRLILPESCEILEAKKTKITGDLKVEVKKDNDAQNKILCIITHSFMSGESFDFVALYKDPDDSGKKINYTTRLTNISLIGNYKEKDYFDLFLLILLISILLMFPFVYFAFVEETLTWISLLILNILVFLFSISYVIVSAIEDLLHFLVKLKKKKQQPKKEDK